MNVKRVLLALAVLAACYALMTPTAAMANPDKLADAEFAAMDGNHNGSISAAEHVSAAARMFKTMDINADGRVTAAEMSAAHKQVTGKKAKPGDMSSADKIKVIDGNGDGVLSAAEHAIGAHKMFHAMDVIRDGQLSRAEMSAARATLTRAPAKG